MGNIYRNALIVILLLICNGLDAQTSSSVLVHQETVNGNNTGIMDFFSYPRRAAAVNTGSVEATVVLDADRHFFTYGIDRAIKWYPTPDSSGSENAQFDSPLGIDLDESGNIFVADTDNERIQKFEFDFSTGYLYYVDVVASGILYPVDVVITGNYFWIIDGSKVKQYTLAGSLIYTLGSTGSGAGQFNNPTGISARVSGTTISETDIYVADAGNDRVVLFTKGSSDNTYSSWNTISIPNSSLTDIASDVDGNVYVTDQQQDKIHLIGWQDKDYLGSFGSFGSGNNEFDNPYSISIAPGTNEVGLTENWTATNGIKNFKLAVDVLNLAATKNGTDVDISYVLMPNASVTVKVKDSGGTVVRNLITNVNLAASSNRQHIWNADYDNGNPVPDGNYTVEVTASVNGYSVTRTTVVAVVSSGGGQLIENLTVNDGTNASDWSVQSNLQIGDTQYGDRSYTLSSIPSALLGSQWIRSANDSKSWTGTTLASFTISASTDVYVAHNDDISPKPSWLASWTDTGDDITNDEGSPKTFSLFTQQFSANSTVSLGDNGDTGFGMYFVIAKISSGSTDILAINPSNLTFSSSASSQNVTVTSNISWTVSDNQSWLSVSPSSSSGNGTVSVSATENTGSTGRSGTVTFTGGSITRTVTVSQDGATADELTVSPSSLSFSPSASSQNVTVTSNIGWTVSDNQSWLSVTPASGSTNGTVSVSATENTGTSSRSGTVTISGGSITRTVSVTQGGTGGGGSTHVWLEAECGNVGSLWNTNTSGSASSGDYVTIQSGNSSTGSVPSNTNGRITYTFSVGQTDAYIVWGRVITPSSSDDSFWLQMDSGAWTKWNDIPQSSSWSWDDVHDSDNGNQQVTYSLSSGSHTLTVAYREDGAQLDKFYITNSGDTPSGQGSTASNCGGPPADQLDVSPSSLTFTSSASSQNVTVTSNIGWTVSDNQSWLSVTPASGSTNGTVSVSATENTGTTSRSGTVTFTGGSITRTVTVSQDGATADELTVSPSSLSFNSSASSQNVTMTSNISWSASDNQSWLSVSPTSSSGNGTVSVTATENTGTSSRSGTVTISGGSINRTVNITQGGTGGGGLPVVENFESYSDGSDPTDWLDTGANNSLTEEDLFKVFDVSGNKVLGTTSTSTNIHSHYTATGSNGFTSYEYSGRMMITNSSGGVGVTFMSNYPNADEYYRLRRTNNNSAFHLTEHGGIISGGVTDTGITPTVNIWYRFRIQVNDTGSQTNIVAKVWQDGSSEPSAWQIDAYDASSGRFTSGTFGVWSLSSGSKYWDDLSVVALNGSSLDISPSSLTFTSSASSQNVIVTSNISWSASDNQSWLSVSPTNSSGNGTVSVTATENTGTSSRSGTVTISGGSITGTVSVTQGGVADQLDVSPSSLTFTSSASSQNVTVTSNISWSASDNQSWLSVSPTNSSGNGTVSVTATENTGSSSRSGTVTISGGSFTRTVSVTQGGTGGGTEEIVSLTLNSHDGWRDVGNMTNGSTADRADVASAGTGKSVTYDIPSGYTITRARHYEDNSGNYNVDDWRLEYNDGSWKVAFDWTAEDVDAGWKEVDFPDHSNVTQVRYSFKDDNSNAEVFQVELYGIQGGSTEQLDVSPGSLTFSSSSGSQNVAVTSNISWTVSDNQSWLSVSPTSSSGSGTVSVTATENTGTSGRSGTVTISGASINRTVNITQGGTGGGGLPVVENFESYSDGSDPADWFDTGANNSLTETDLFKVFDVSGNKVLGTTSTSTNIHTHYNAIGSASFTSYEYSGRMMITNSSGGIGVTFLSNYPNADEYYRLRRTSSNSAFYLTEHGGTISGGVTSTGVTPTTNTWYRFRIQVNDTGTQTDIVAKVWQDGSSEPSTWQIDAYDATSGRFTSGTFGVWSLNSGSKYWDDLSVVVLNGSSPQSELTSVESSSSLPEKFSLLQNYPNPFNPATVIEYSVPEPIYVNLDIFNFRGQKVRSLTNAMRAAGSHKVIWDAKDSAGNQVSNGLYMYIFKAGTFIETRKMLFLK